MTAVMDDSQAHGRATVWHVGRSGEVAGGMTQVINGYLKWPDFLVDVRVIPSRDGSTGVRAWWLFARAVLRMLFLRSPARNVVVVHLSQGGSFVREGLLLRIARTRGFGTVAHLHGSRFVEFSRERPALVGRTLRAATRVIVLSEATRQAVREFVPDARIELVPNAVPLGGAGRKEPLVVFGGSVSRRKGVDILLDAWRTAGAGRGWKLIVAGPCPEADLVSGLPADCEAPGALPHDELMRLLDRSSVAVLPSRDEAMPMFILEAMARRNCVIATRVGGIAAVLENDRGILIDAGDLAQLQAAIERSLGDDVFRNEVAAAGFERFERHFSAAAIYPRVEALWLSAMQDPEPQGGQVRNGPRPAP